MILWWGILLTALLQSLTVATGDDVHVYAFVGDDDVRLPCHTTVTEGFLKWYVGEVNSEGEDDAKILNTFLPDGKPTIEKSGYDYDPGTKALIIKTVSLDKEGFFTCAVNDFIINDVTVYRHVYLNVYVLQGAPRMEGLDDAVTENVEKTIQCTVDSVKPSNVTFEWSYKNNGNVIVQYRRGRHVINNDRTFRVQDTLYKAFVRRDNGDSLRCRVKHGVKTNRVEEVTKKIIVQYKYKTTVVDPDPSVQPVLAGFKTLHCREDETGSPETSATLWFKGGLRLNDSQKYSGADSRSLTIGNLRFGDASSYTCRVDNSAGPGGQGEPYRLEVLYAPQVTLTVPNDGQVREGAANFNIVCNVNARPSRLSYIRLTVAGRQVAEKVDTNDHTLEHQIDEVDREHKGIVVCEAENDISVGRGSVNLTVFYGPVGLPKITTPSDVVLVGSTVTLTCDLSRVDLGHPPGKTVVWYKGQSEWASQETNTITVEIESIQDGGQFACLVKNGISSGPKSVPVNITAEVPVAFTSTTGIHDFTPRYDDPDFKVTYTVSGSNPETVQWYNDSSLVKAEDFILTNRTIQGEFSHGQTTAVEVSLLWNLNVRTLDTCSNVEFFNGNYYLTAIGTAAGSRSQVTKTFSITVQYPPFWKGHGDVVSSALDVRAVIKCEVCAHPPTDSMTWMFNGRQNLPNGATVKKNDVVIKNVEMAHFGNYTCTAKNTVEEKSFVIMLQQRGPPHKVTNFRAVARTSRTFLVKWTAGNDGGYPGMTFDLEHRPLGGVWKSKKGISECPKEGDVCNVRISGLKENSKYQLRVRPRNSKNGDPYGPYESFQVSTRAKPQVSDPEGEVTETALKVTWNYTRTERRKRDTTNSYRVDVEVSYHRAGDQEQFYPLKGDPKIPASNQTATIPGTFDPDAEYRIALNVYEANIIEATYETNMAATYKTSYTVVSPPVAAASTVSSKAGIIVGVLLVIALVAVIAFFIWRRRKEKHGKGRTTKTQPEDVTNGLIDNPKELGGVEGRTDRENDLATEQSRPPVARPRTSRKNKLNQNNSHPPKLEGSAGGSAKKRPVKPVHESPYVNTQLGTNYKQGQPQENPYSNVENVKRASTDGVYENVVVNDYQNVSLPVIGTSSTDNEGLYDEVAKEQKCKLNVGPDGTIYTDVCFSNGREETPQDTVEASDIRGVENRVEYARIDFNKMREERKKRDMQKLEEDEGL